MRRLLSALVLAALAGACASSRPAPETPSPTTPAVGEKADTAAPAAPPAADAQAWRARPPAPGEPPELVLPRFEQEKLPNGLTLVVSTRKELPLVAVGVAFAAGSAQDPVGKAGLAELTYRLLLEGTRRRDAIALAQAFADLGASPGLAPQPDGALLSTAVLKRNVDGALALLAEVVQQPGFKPADFERRKRQHLSELVQRLGQPQFLAQQAYLEAFYGARHPYGHPVPGTPSTVQSLTLADARRFYAQHAGPAAVALVVTGDVTREEARALAEKHFGGWKGSARLPPAPPAPPATPRSRVVYVPKPGLQQTVIAVGRPGVPLGHPDEHALELASTVFGSFFGSRLNMNLREAKGYSYGARAASLPRHGVGPLIASSQVHDEVTGPALQEFMKEMADLETRPITEQELEAAREGLVRAFPGSFETVEGLASSAAQLFIGRRPMDEFERTVKALQTTSAAEVQRVAEAYFEPGAMHIVLVGDPTRVREQVGPLGYGRLEEHALPLPQGAGAASAGGAGGAGARKP